MNSEKIEYGGRSGFTLKEGREELKDLKEGQADFATRMPPFVREMRDFFDNRIDLNMLHQLAVENARKAGMSSARVNKIPSNRIFIADSKKLIGEHDEAAYLPRSNAIIFDFETLCNDIRLRSLGKISNETLYATYLSRLAHEYTHATGVMLKKIFDTDTYIQKGHQVGRLDETDPNKLNASILRLFNEGVTEIISEEMVVEYLRRIPIDLHEPRYPAYDHVLTSASFSSMPSPVAERPYATAVEFVHLFADRISRLCGVPAEQVLNAFKGSYYDGNGFFAKGDNGIFDEVLGEKFMQAFLSADTEEDIEKIIGRFKMKLTDETLKGKLMNIFHLHHDEAQ